MFDATTYDYLDQNTIAEYVPITEMFVDRYQRPVKEARVNLIIRRGFDPDALGTILLCLRNPDQPFSGLYAIVDGNHRVQACRKLGITHVFSKVMIDKTYEQEAELFTKLNARNRLSALDMFRARIEHGELQALEMRDILAQYGLKVGAGSEGLGCVNAVFALDRLYKELGPAGYAEVIGLIYRAWNTERRAWIGVIIDGVKQFWIRYRAEVDEKRLVDRLKLTHPEDLLRNAGIAMVKRGSVGSRVGRVIVETYNSGLRSKQLPPWVDHPGKVWDTKAAPAPKTR